jgi:hypothetical protein
MKRFMLFGGDRFYPLGGMEDFIKDFDAISETYDYLLRMDTRCEWWQIYDTSVRGIKDRKN